MVYAAKRSVLQQIRLSAHPFEPIYLSFNEIADPASNHLQATIQVTSRDV